MSQARHCGSETNKASGHRKESTGLRAARDHDHGFALGHRARSLGDAAPREVSTERPRMSDVGSAAEEPMVYLSLRRRGLDSNLWFRARAGSISGVCALSVADDLGQASDWVLVRAYGREPMRSR